jgi:D-arabinose 1-dehydrogenase-like Zn-dependent alcohol dehydrogenase
LKIPDSLPLEKVGPILCAGITLFAPMKYWGAIDTTKKLSIGVVGIGGLGTMGIKLAKAAGHRVVAFSTSANKEAAAK